MQWSYRLLFLPVGVAFAVLAQPASAKCVARTVTQIDGARGTITVVAPDGGSADLGAAGYKDATCGAIDKDKYRAQVCDPKTIGNSGVRRQLEIQTGVPFAQLCAAARAEAGLAPLPADQAVDAAPATPIQPDQAVPNGSTDAASPAGGM